PTLTAKCNTVTIMSYGFDPYRSSWSPFHGAAYAVVDSVAKIAAAGGDVTKVRLTFQEYFKKLGQDPYLWGQPFSALLGAYHAQMGLGLPAIGGKDSMSGTFNDIDVPPTLCSFAVGVSDRKHVVTPELKKAGDYLYLLEVKPDKNNMPNYTMLQKMYATLRRAMGNGDIRDAWAVGFGGVAEAVSKMAFGNRMGVVFDGKVAAEELFEKKYGALVVEVENCGCLPPIARKIGRVTDDGIFTLQDGQITLDEMLKAWTGRLEDVFSTKSKANNPKAPISTKTFRAKEVHICQHKVARPKVFIPTFPGTNCEYDSARAFLRAGAEVETLVFRNQNAAQIGESVDAFARAIGESQIVMIPGGFSAGDEPEGSAKFITSVFRNAKISEAVMELLNQRDGLMLGICNGFQALVKLGLVPYGEIRPQTADSPTLTFNTIGRHQSMMAYTRVVSNLSPWLQQAEVGKSYVIPVSHGEGRFVAPKECIDQLFANGQVATQYVDLQGRPTMEEPYNMNGSYIAIEGITSPDGRVLGKMAHSERRREGTYMNIYGEQDQRIFESGVAYFLN
ncbi:MAG: phosphoribosylformylglycinamidine synthase subunit PurQ, partial [Bacteroidales bacterium]|nr:phosphoribosylformylglycinamidine synthase subunit PurQ [Bacteroidales bacterium]